MCMFNLFLQVQLAAPGSLLFRPDMRLEAKDPSNPELVRVATIKKVTDKQLLIHFDGCDDKKDYWCASDSLGIRPPMWSGKHQKKVEKPKGQPWKISLISSSKKELWTWLKGY